MHDLLICNGTVVTPAGVGKFDVFIDEGKITSLSSTTGNKAEASKTIDASGRVVIPGGIEPHAHIGGPRQPERSGALPVSKAALYGGTTTVIDFATQIPGHDLFHAVKEAEDRWEGNAFTNYAYHPIITHGADLDSIRQIPELVKNGIASFKIFTTSIRPPSPQMQNNHIDFGRLGEIMSQIEESGGILLVHSEDDEMVHYNYDRLKTTDEWDWWNMHRIHTNQSEDLSFRRVTRLAERTNCPIYFVHVSAKEGVNEIKRCRSLGLPIYGETLHNYICFTSDNYREDNGMKFHTYPSLKGGSDVDSLWAGLLDGTISTLATDLVSTTWEEKIKYKTVADVTGGHNGIETRVGIAYTEGVVNRNMSLERFVDITSTNAARLLGMYPQKGVLAPGSDADITIIDPQIDKMLSMDDLHLENYSIWEGWHIKGWPTTTVLGGETVVENGILMTDKPSGKFVERCISSEVTKSPAY